jgi:SNF2 family DNA or RNA helicase
MNKRLSTIVMGNKLVLPVQSNKIKDFIPHAKVTYRNGRMLAVMPHKLEEAKILRNLGIQTPSPILSQYKWRGRFLPFAHQRATADFITMNQRCFVFSGMGSGKTAAVLWAIDYLSEVHRVSRVLVVCPLSVVGVWEDEVFGIVPHTPVATLVGSKDNRRKRLARGAEICVTNFDGVKTLLPELKAGGFDMVIVDEASDAYRNHNTDRHKAILSMLKPDTRMVVMTATPTPTGPTDAYGLAKLLGVVPGSLSFNRWRDMVMVKRGPFKWTPRANWEQQVHDLLQPAIKFSTEECIDLPPISHMYRAVEMGPDQKKAYAAMKRSLITTVDGGEIKAVNAAVLLTKLLQISMGVVKDSDGTPRYLDNGQRLDTLLEVIREAGNKALVFVPFRASQQQVHDYLVKQGLTAEVINGDVNQTTRSAIFREFQNGELQVIVAHPQTASHGLNLTAASNVVWFGPVFSLERYVQANARVARPGQKSHMNIHHIYATEIEKEVFNALVKKGKMLDTVMELFTNLESYD